MERYKYQEIKARYDTIEWEKAPYNTVVKRIIHDKMDREKAWTPWSLKHWQKVWDEFGKPCSKCKIYKTWDLYTRKSKTSSVKKYDSSCRECKKLQREVYKNSLSDEEKKRRRKRARHIEVWSKIGLVDYIHYDTDWNPREVVWDVVAYRHGVGYTLQNKYFWLSKVVAFRSSVGNYRYYLIEEAKQQEEIVVAKKEFDWLPC